MNNTNTDNLPLGQCSVNFWNPSNLSIIAITTIACLLAVLFNALVIIPVKQKKELRSIPFILLTSLAAVDILIGAVVQPLFCAAGIFRLLNVNETICILFLMYSFTLHLVLASIYHLTAMAWERYVAIKNTINYKSIFTSSRVQICAIASRVSAAIPCAFCSLCSWH